MSASRSLANAAGTTGDPQAELRKLWRAYWRRATAKVGVTSREPMPDILRGLTCGAKTRAGTPCRRTDLEMAGRCKLHGGQSCGPRTSSGKDRARANLALRWARSKPHETLAKPNVGEFSEAAREGAAGMSEHDGRLTSPDGSLKGRAVSGAIAHAREAPPVASNVAPAAGMGVIPTPAGPVLNPQPTVAALPSDTVSAIAAIAQRRRDRERSR